jgi:hypothetical protein
MLAALTALLAIQFAVLGSYLVLFLQHGMGESELTTGLVLAVAGIFTPLLSLRTGRFTDRHGPRGLVVGGLALATAGLLWLGLVAPLNDLLPLVPGLLTFSLSLPAVFTPGQRGGVRRDTGASARSRQWSGHGGAAARRVARRGRARSRAGRRARFGPRAVGHGRRRLPRGHARSGCGHGCCRRGRERGFPRQRPKG